jgi:hypothetical protein
MSGKTARNKELDEEFIRLTILIQKAYEEFDKHTQIKVEKWIEKLAKTTSNIKWKQNRNLYTKLLLSCVIKSRFDSPFDKFPREGSLPILNKYHVKNRVGEHFEKLLRSEQVEHLIDT